MIAIHLNAGNDTNGNPRRMYVALNDNGSIAGTVDEGYSGSAEVTKRWPGIVIGPTFVTSPSEYRNLKNFLG